MEEKWPLFLIDGEHKKRVPQGSATLIVTIRKPNVTYAELF